MLCYDACLHYSFLHCLKKKKVKSIVTNNSSKAANNLLLILTVNINGKRQSSISKYHCNTSNIGVHLSNLKHEDALHCLQITWSNQDKLVQNWAAVSISALSRDVTQDNEDHMTQVKNYPFAAFLFFTGLIYEVLVLP